MKIQAISGISHRITDTIDPQNRGQKCVASFFAVTLPLSPVTLVGRYFVPEFFLSFSRELELSNEVLNSYNGFKNHN